MSTLRVDKISPFQSSSVEIDGAITIPGVATTGSNTFVGNQIVSGSIVATGDITAPNLTGSAAIDTSSFATTGSNTFVDNQTLTAGALQVSSGSLGANRVSGLTSTGLSITDPTGGMGQVKNIALAANPSALGGPFAAFTQPTLYGLGTAGPYQIAEFQSQTNFTDGAATFKVPLIVSGGIVATSDITAPNLTGSAPIDTSVFATTGSNTFSGNQTVNGNSVQNISAPGSESQTDFVTVSGANIAGKAYNYTNFGILNYPSFGSTYADAFAFESYDGLDYNFGSELKVNGQGVTAFVLASGSQSAGNIALLDNFNGLAVAALQADRVTIGKPNSQIFITGSVNLTDSYLQLASLDPLPAGAEGQLANSGSNLYFYSGSAWQQIAFV